MTALTQQIGGDHYKELAIQPVEYIHANSIPFIEGCIIKYATRWRDKGGLQDLQKIIHFTQMLIDLEFKPDKLPSSFGQQNMIDPADVEIGEESGGKWYSKDELIAAINAASVEPASLIDDESPRADAIGQNGNTGEHYDDPWAGAPEWAKYKAQDECGSWFLFELRPIKVDDYWENEGEESRFTDAGAGEYNPSWRTTLISR